MICEAFNEMGKFVGCVINGTYSCKNEVKLWEVVLMTIIFSAVLLILSWWVLPIRFMFKKCGNITFYCKNKKGD